MKITLEKIDGKFEIKMIGTAQEANVIIEALENSVTDNQKIASATTFLRKKLTEQTRR